MTSGNGRRVSQRQLSTLPPCPRSPLMFCERFWSMSVKPTSLLYAESARSSALARKMSFIAVYVLDTKMSSRRLLNLPTLQDGFARLELNNHPQSWQQPCE